MGPGRMPTARKMGCDVEKSERRGLTICVRAKYTVDMSRKKQAKAGRPPKAPEARRSYRATVRLTPEQYRRLIDGAEKAGVTLSTYILSRLEV